MYKPVLIAEIFGITGDSTKLLAITTKDLGVECVLAAAAITQLLHHGVNLRFKNLSKLEAQCMNQPLRIQLNKIRH